MPLGLYLSVPFCRTKCSYCNFSSAVFSPGVFEGYVNRLSAEIQQAATKAGQAGGHLERSVESIYLGGGTPTVLDISQLEHLFVTISQNFDVCKGAEITVECAPGTLTDRMIASFARCGVNRVSLGVQSFVDREAASVGRLHGRDIVLKDLERLRAAGLVNISIDLIAGLPHQTKESWQFSVAELIATQTPHVSVYMLEVDEDSRLGRELIAGGSRYHAHIVPDEDLTADLYSTACEQLQAAGVEQYEISNFARPGYQSRHNLKYWTRQPYLGFGVDAHSMLTLDRRAAAHDSFSAVRIATADSLHAYLAGEECRTTFVSQQAALEETLFLGLRLNRGVDLAQVAETFGKDEAARFSDPIREFIETGLLARNGNVIRLTKRGRLLSNEVFQEFISVGETANHKNCAIMPPPVGD